MDAVKAGLGVVLDVCARLGGPLFDPQAFKWLSDAGFVSINLSAGPSAWLLEHWRATSRVRGGQQRTSCTTAAGLPLKGESNSCGQMASNVGCRYLDVMHRHAAHGSLGFIIDTDGTPAFSATWRQGAYFVVLSSFSVDALEAQRQLRKLVAKQVERLNTATGKSPSVELPSQRDTSVGNQVGRALGALILPGLIIAFIVWFARRKKPKSPAPLWSPAMAGPPSSAWPPKPPEPRSPVDAATPVPSAFDSPPTRQEP
jgi:hypothetical protein